VSKQPTIQRAAILLTVGTVAAVAVGHGVAYADSLPSPVVTSAVFPPQGAPEPVPVIRTPGAFTFSVPPSSGVVEFDYVLNGTLSTGGPNPHVAVGIDGTATTPDLRSAQWGTNVLTVEAVDAAGAVSQPTSYYFYLASPAQPDRHSDYDGDGNIDLLSVDAHGALQFSAGRGDGSVAPAVDAHPGVDLTGALIAGGGNEARGIFEDVFLFRDGYLYAVVGDGLGGVPTQQEVLVSPPSGLTAWPAFTQLVSPGDLTGHRRADLIGKVGDQLLLFPSVALYRYSAPVQIAGSGWSCRTVVGVVDANGDGLPDLIARDDASGRIWLYPGSVGGTFGDETDRVFLGGGLSAANFPLAVAKGDATGDGLPDIWAVHKNGDLFVLPGLAGGGYGDPQNLANHAAWADVTALG